MSDLLIVAAIGWALICGLWLGMWTAASGDPWRDRDERRHCLRMAWLTPAWPFVGAFLLARLAVRNLPRLFREAWMSDPKPKPAEPSRVKRDKQKPGKWSNYERRADR